MIGEWSSHQIASMIGADTHGANTNFNKVTTDSRADCKNSLFVALKGANFDGHKFIAQAVEQGAVAVMAEQSAQMDKALAAQLIVANTTTGLGQLGAENRRRFAGKVVAITGSSGKTTVKEMVAAILWQTGKVCKTQGNLNNHFGVPLSLLTLEETHVGAVFELGASGLNEIAYTAGLVKPDVAILNNAQAAHIEGFGSLNNVMLAKGEIVQSLPANGIAVLNADDQFFENWQAMAESRRIVSFGLSKTAQVTARDIRLNAGSTHFTLVCPIGETRIHLPLPGNHNVSNALAASAAAIALGLPIEQIMAGLANAARAPGRLDLKSGLMGCEVIDDSYNASPAAMKEAMRVLASYPGRKIAVLGHMAELGELAVRSHIEAGSWAQQLGIEELWVTGQWAREYQQGFGKSARVFADKKQLIDALVGYVIAGDVVLVKGSRSACMEEVVRALCEESSQ